MKLEPLPECKVGEQDGWKATGFLYVGGSLRKQELGVYASWNDADQACDEWHSSNRHTDRAEIERHYRKEER